MKNDFESCSLLPAARTVPKFKLTETLPQECLQLLKDSSVLKWDSDTAAGTS